jgi:hypothetical protein
MRTLNSNLNHILSGDKIKKVGIGWGQKYKQIIIKHKGFPAKSWKPFDIHGTGGET